MSVLILKTVLVGACVAGVLVLAATPAFAHAETRAGPYTVAIGLGTEPAYVGFPNSVEVIVHERASDDAVSTAASTLTATIGFGASPPMPVSLQPNFDEDAGGSPGDYRGAFVPTQPGEYTIHVEGKIRGTPIDKTITSSPTTFDDVLDPATIEYPTRNPTATELNAKLDREVARVRAEAVADANAARDAGRTSQLLAIVAIALAVAGVGVGAFGIVRARG